jgi:acyl-coenzyme A synthetase/AMP-(fatty) acid ligase
MSYLPDDKSVEKAGSIGIAIPGGTFSLIDIDGKEITEPNTMGELVYIGDNVTLGYAESDRDLSLLDENNGRLITGDMAEYDSEGYYYIVGRKKRFLKLFGNRVNLQEIEKTLCDAGYDCVCGGADDLLKIYLTNHGKAEEARAFISQKTGLNMVGFKAIEVREIPRNEAGKVLYSKLEELYA